MLDLADGAVPAVDAHHLHDGVGQRALALEGVVFEQEAVVDGVAQRGGLFHQRQQVAAQAGKVVVERGLGHALFVHVQHGVVGVLIGGVVERKAAVVVDELGKVGLEGGVVVVNLGLVPDAGGEGLLHLVVHVLLQGDAVGAGDVLGEHLHLAAGDQVQLVLAFSQLLDHALEFGGGLQAVVFLAQYAHGLGIVLRRALGHGGLKVVVHHAHRVLVGVHFVEIGLEFLDAFLHKRFFLSAKMGSAGGHQREHLGQLWGI